MPLITKFLGFPAPFWYRAIFRGRNQYTLLKIFKGTGVSFIPHSWGLILLSLLKFWVKQWSGRMLYTTASKHLQTLWNWPYVYSIEKLITVPLNILSSVCILCQWMDDRRTVKEKMYTSAENFLFIFHVLWDFHIGLSSLLSHVFLLTHSSIRWIHESMT